MTKSAACVNDRTLQGLLGYHLKRASNVVQADLSRTLKPFGLRTLTYSALVLIADNAGLSQTQLAEALGMERPNLVAILDELETRGLILREPAPSDRRAYALKVTPEGRALFEQATLAVRDHERTLLAKLDGETRSTVIAAMDIIRNAYTTG